MGNHRLVINAQTGPVFYGPPYMLATLKTMIPGRDDYRLQSRDPKSQLFLPIPHPRITNFLILDPRNAITNDDKNVIQHQCLQKCLKNCFMLQIHDSSMYVTEDTKLGKMFCPVLAVSNVLKRS